MRIFILVFALRYTPALAKGGHGGGGGGHGGCHGGGGHAGGHGGGGGGHAGAHYVPFDSTSELQEDLIARMIPVDCSIGGCSKPRVWNPQIDPVENPVR